jgi:uncharacterized RDD family membrane protein YckC
MRIHGDRASRRNGLLSGVRDGILIMEKFFSLALFSFWVGDTDLIGDFYRRGRGDRGGGRRIGFGLGILKLMWWAGEGFWGNLTNYRAKTAPHPGPLPMITWGEGRRGGGCLVCAVVLLSLLAVKSPALGAAPALSIVPAPKQRDLMAEGSDNHFWVAHVGKALDGNYLQTTIVWRPRWSGNDEWSPMPSVAQRVISVATSNDELMLVLQNGQWEIADGQDIRTGPTPPQGDVMLAIASDPEAVWAVVRGWVTPPASTTQAISGAISAANLVVNAGGVLAATAPTTEPSTQAMEPRLVVCHFVNGKWIDARALPDDVMDDPAQMSLVVVKQLPMLAWRNSEGRISVSSLTAQSEWTKPAIVNGPAELDNFKLLSINERAVLWLAGELPTSRPTTRAAGESVGDVLIGDDFTRRLPLQMPTTLPPNIGSQTLVAAFGNLRWIAYAGDQQVEQDYSLQSFPDSFPPATKMSIVANPKPAAIPLVPWILGDAVLVAVAAIAAVRQRQLAMLEGLDAAAAAKKKEEKPQLAPLGVRFVAGLVDLAPILAVIAIVHPANTSTMLASVDAKSLQSLTELATLAYLLHTLVAEVICGQSLGKMAFGLKVVGPDGGRPTRLALVIRNLLRVVDVALALPLVTVLISPLRQRVGDMVAGTVVVAPEGDGEEAS